MSVVALPITWTLVALRFIGSRPSRGRWFDPPGLSACLAVSAASLLNSWCAWDVVFILPSVPEDVFSLAALRVVEPLPLAAAVLGDLVVLDLQPEMASGAELDRSRRAMPGDLLARGGIGRSYPSRVLPMRGHRPERGSLTQLARDRGIVSDFKDRSNGLSRPPRDHLDPRLTGPDSEEPTMLNRTTPYTRRQILGGAAGALAFPTIVPSTVFGTHARLRRASGSRSVSSAAARWRTTTIFPTLLGFGDVQAVAVCEVDRTRREHAKKSGREGV